MKRIYICAAGLCLCCCNTDNDGENAGDEMLAGTEWRCDEWKTWLEEPDGIITTTPSILEYIIDNVPGVIYDTTTSYGAEATDTTRQDAVSQATLTFSTRTCRFHSLYYRPATITHFLPIYTTYTLPDQTSEWLKVENGMVFLYDPAKERYEFVPCSNQLTECTGRQFLSEEDVRLDLTEEHYTFDYQRNGHELLLSSPDRKWTGLLDPEAWTLSFTQLLPEKKELPVFYLR